MLVSLGMGEDTSHEGGLPAQITEERLICRDQQPERTEAIHERLYAALNCLTKQEEEILWAKANHGTLRAIAAQHNLTPFTVRKIIDRAILKARRHLNLDPNMEIVWLKA
jgi:DNA-binding CsgD family transcriptional regulator